MNASNIGLLTGALALLLTADRFRILITNPGGVTKLTLAPAHR